MNDDLNAYPKTDMFGRVIEGGKWGFAKRRGDDWVIEPDSTGRMILRADLR